jgi:hypothetical protein
MQPQANGPPQPQHVMPAPAPGPPMMQHAQYVSQHHMQGVNYSQPLPSAHAAPALPHVHQQQQQQQQQLQQQVQSFPHQGLNGGWQSDQDYNERRKMIAKMYVRSAVVQQIL